MITAMIISCQLANGQKDKISTDHYDEDFDFRDVTVKTSEYQVNDIDIYNLNGDITIKSYAGTTVRVTTKNTIKANTQQAIDAAKNEIKLGAESTGALTLFIDKPYDTRPGKHGGNHVNWENKKYDFTVDYTIELPANTRLNLNTVNGDITVENVNGDIKTNNVNGDITMSNVSKVYTAVTVNGDVNVNSTTGAEIEAEYRTVNGDINLSLPVQFSGECQFKSLNGDFYTDFEDIETLGAVKTTKENHNGVTRYKLDKSQGIKIGTGKSKIKFETLNGDVHLSKA